MSWIFDDSFNGLNPIAFSNSIADNKVHNLNQTKYPTDRGLFELSVIKKMTLLIENQIIKVAFGQEIVDYCKNLKDQGIEAKHNS